MDHKMNEDTFEQESLLLQCQGEKDLDKETREKIKEIALLMAGQAQGLFHTEKYTELAGLAILKKIKDTKIYRGIGNGRWESFCESCGFSYKTIDDKLLHLQKLGAEFLEIAKRCRLTNRDLRRIEALPSDTRINVVDKISAIENPGKEQIKEFIGAIEDQQTELTILKEKQRNLDGKLDKKDKLIVQGREQVYTLEDEVRALKEKLSTGVMTYDDQKALDIIIEVKYAFHSVLRKIASIDLDKASNTTKSYVAAIYEHITRKLRLEIQDVTQAHRELAQGDLFERFDQLNYADVNPVDRIIVSTEKDKLIRANIAKREEDELAKRRAKQEARSAGGKG